MKTLAFFLIFSMIAAQSPESSLLAGSYPSDITVDPSGQYQPVVQVHANIPGVQPLTAVQSDIVETGTSETIQNITSFSKGSSKQSTIDEHAQLSSELMDGLAADSESNEKNSKTRNEEPKQTPRLKGLPYGYGLIAERPEQTNEEKAGSGGTLDFFSKSALSRDPTKKDDEKSSIERALRAIFNQKLEDLQAGPTLDDLLKSNYNDSVEKTEIDGSDFVVVDVVNFTRDIRVIHQFLNPPERLHPWLKWLLYLGRVTPQMLEVYYGALQKRDQIFKLAFESAVNGNKKYKIRYQGKMMNDFPVYVMPEDAQGLYELVMTSDQGGSAIASQNPAGPQP